MSNSSLLIRSLVIYAVCVVAAVVLGCVLANWDDKMSFFTGILLLSLLLIPLFLRWHHVWLIAVWNTPAVFFLLQGKPTLALGMAFASLFISILQHALNRKLGFIQVRSLTVPLLVLAGVVLVTAKLSGGIGLNIFGSANVGGKRYIYLLGGIAGYFALSAQRIPPNKAVLYVSIFFLAGVTSMISDLAHFVAPSALYYILLVFPPTNWWGGNAAESVVGGPEYARLGGIASGCVSLLFWLMAVYGIRGIFNLRKFWRLPLFCAAVVGCMLGGFRSMLVLFLLTFAFVFCFEGLMRSRFLPGIVCGGLMLIAAAVPFTDQMPFAVQRTLSVVPFINLDPSVRGDAEGSTEWRVQMWNLVLPEVPKYLIVGKGLSIDANELTEATTFKPVGGDPEAFMLAGDYHSGPLSLIIPFGLPGVFAFLWIVVAGTRVLWKNYRYGDPALMQINTFLLAAFLVRTVFFLAIFGSFYGDVFQFTGLLGLSVAINGGVCQPVPASRKRAVEELRLAPVAARMTA